MIRNSVTSVPLTDSLRSNSGPVRNVDIYDSSSNTLNTTTTIITARYYSAAAAAGNWIVVAGGQCVIGPMI